MSAFTYGFWGTVDHSLQSIGRGATWLLARNSRSAEDVAYAALGGSLLCAIFGGIIGLGMMALSHGSALVEGLLIGLMLGACVGVFFGSFVETVDEYIRNVLSSLKLK